MIPWHSFRETEALRREMNRILDTFVGREGPFFRSVFLPGRAARRYPLVNVYEDPEVVRVEALAPGLDAGSLEVTVKGNSLLLQGEKKPLEGVKREAYHRSERATGKFVRTLEIESEIDEEKVTADYQNGILIVTLPKSERAKPKKITVSVK